MMSIVVAMRAKVINLSEHTKSFKVFCTFEPLAW